MHGVGVCVVDMKQPSHWEVTSHLCWMKKVLIPSSPPEVVLIHHVPMAIPCEFQSLFTSLHPQ